MTMRCAILAAFVLIATSEEASAFLKICNKAGENVFVAVGYNNDGDWIAEGWWEIAENSCDNIINTALTNKFYYIRAEGDDGGIWEGEFMFCTTAQRFTLIDAEDCVSSTINRQGFFEVDTGENPNWTTTLTP